MIRLTAALAFLVLVPLGAASPRAVPLTPCTLAGGVAVRLPKVEQPAWTKARVRSDTPVLFVVGGADPQDPLANVSRATRELPASRTVVVPAGGHGSVQLGCVPRIAQQFIERGSASDLDTRCAARYAPPQFVVP